MSRRLRIHADASAELETAARWYERQRTDLGLEFVAAVDRVVEYLVGWPDAGTPVGGVPEDLPVRQVLVERLPYHAAYLVGDGVIHLLAHDRRRPHYWRHR